MYNMVDRPTGGGQAPLVVREATTIARIDR